MTVLLLIAGPSVCFLAGVLFTKAPNWRTCWGSALLFLSYVVWHSAAVNHLMPVAP